MEVIIDGVRYVPAQDNSPLPSSRWYDALDVLELDKPTGAWGKLNGGVKASRADVDYNRKRLPASPYTENVEEAAKAYDLPPWLLMAIFDRESNHGRSLDSRGYGDRGNGFGVGQVDGRYHTQRGRPDPYSPEHMIQCAEILSSYLSDVKKKHPVWPDKYVLKGAVVAYNSGIKNVATVERMDVGTTGADYGADVCVRAQYWKTLW